ncbi:MAG TPA: alpha/beta hydrolase [Sporosarcina psychrophila]|uniref:Alpha/beta hydrolase n=1 Tax=Sporosarcina psychrophila TaxID=1476 RepID=A0A921FZS5_SPOPS|nr:alpha/beta hydrolase [Sporosarcina psychrophila]
MILHTTIVGNGGPIVFLHTGLQTGSTDFEYQREHFKENYKVIMPDLRGHGKSKVDQIDILHFFENSVVDLVDTLNHLEVKKAHIVGASLGALVGLVFIKRYPDRVKSLTLSGVTSEKPSNWAELQRVDASMQMAILENEDAVNYFNGIHLSDWQSFIRTSQEHDWYPFEETSEVSSIQCPALIIVGEDKKHEVIGALKYQAMNELFHVAIVPFASHLVHSEQPEIYTAILDKFLDSIANRDR